MLSLLHSFRGIFCRRWLLLSPRFPSVCGKSRTFHSRCSHGGECGTQIGEKSCISRLATATVFSRISSGYASLCDGRAVERYSVTLCCLNLRCCKNRVFQRRRFFPRIWSGPLMGWTQQTRKLVCSGPTVRVQINASAVFCRIYEPDDLLVRTPVPCQ